MIVKEVNSFLAITFEISKHCPTVENYWRILLPQLQPYKYLEIGSFEGLSTSRFLEIAKTYSLQNTSHRLQVTCIDSWSGGEEHQGMHFGKIEALYESNVQECLSWYPAERRPEIRKIKSLSHQALCKLVGSESNQYDLIYVDGSHHGADTLADIMLCWFLLRVGGVMIMDDYLWKEPTGKGAIHEPKIAIDAFTTIFGQRLQIIMDAPLRQMHFVKRAN